ncbi:alpha/beta hydrolase [Cellulomonas sp. DKR-3]|uniref:Alpha/beta hydrolase n=1 Tax=Cellulomonas fulva TaxID=2835530 RepID=A0ABS5TW51_9CELL|nr:alpha/beta hydrolase [Cellulomonas fulva]MBT0993389.1 alpha/beta hydrolase [Cellulomonas fulva]
MHVPRRGAALAALTALTVTLGLVVGGTTAATAATTPSATPAPADRTSAQERARVDTVDATIDWFDCTNVVGPRFDCGTVDLPLDYDEPEGATTSVALLRYRTADPSRKVGTLFVNPGGPGGSGVDIATYAPDLFPADVLARFDVVGFDPRGTNFSDNVQCWRNLGEQTNAILPLLTTPFPRGAVQSADFVRASTAFGRACSTTGQPLSASMSTADVARDMDVLRRTLGDTRLTYLGFSYGTYLGNVYANLFPDRVRAVVLDGVLDPVAWQGTAATADVPQTQRIKSGDGAWKALQRILAVCGAKGPDYCWTARIGEPTKVFTQLSNKLKKSPIELDYGDGFTATIDYPMMMSVLLSDLYAADAWQYVDWDIDMFWAMAKESSSAKSPERAAAVKRFKARLSAAEAQERAADARVAELAEAPGFAFPYNSAPEAFQSVLCTDGLNPRYASRWPAAAAKAAQTGSGFGPLWTWSSAPCASATWTARAEDSYRGTFTHRTAAPVLVVGNYWDPATNYRGAVKAAALLPNSSLISSNSWGHTAYGTSQCVTKAVTNYLVTGKAPQDGLTCRGDSQPFPTKIDGDSGFDKATTTVGDDRPQVVPPSPGTVPTL